MKNKLVILVLLFAYILGMLRPLAPLISFELRKGYIQEFLCINRSEPITVCGGKCYLNDQLKREAKKQSEEPKPDSLVNLADYPIGIMEPLKNHERSEFFLFKILPHDFNFYYFDFHSSIFRPPVT
ncbi:MAG: hypothetical protein AAFN93_18180 [Bacteroidota bacterium]